MIFTIKKLITPFLLPPGIFVLLLMVIGLAIVFRRRRRMGLVLFFLGLALWAMSIFPTANGLLRGLEADFSIPTHPSGDVIIVLGGGVLQGVPDLSGSSAPSPLMMGRIVTAARLYRRLRLPIIVTGGRWFDENDSEAQVGKRFLVDLGVPEQAIIEEGKARDTAENARFSAAICRQMGYSKPILLTSAYHLKRALMAFEAEGMRVSPMPAYFLGLRHPSYTWLDMLPRSATLDKVSRALHEYIGICYYHIKAW